MRDVLGARGEEAERVAALGAMASENLEKGGDPRCTLSPAVWGGC